MGSNHICLAIIRLDSALKRDKNSYPQVFLKECKYINENVIRHITQDRDFFSDSDEEQFFSLMNT